MFSPTIDETAFGLDSDGLMLRQCSNLSDLAFEMEMDDAEMFCALPSHASASSETSTAPPSPLFSSLFSSMNKNSIGATKHPTARDTTIKGGDTKHKERSRTSPTDVVSTFSEMESKLRSLGQSQSLLRSNSKAGRTPPPQCVAA
jgi:hypothetical protein